MRVMRGFWVGSRKGDDMVPQQTGSAPWQSGIVLMELVTILRSSHVRGGGKV